MIILDKQQLQNSFNNSFNKHVPKFSRAFSAYIDVVWEEGDNNIGNKFSFTDEYPTYRLNQKGEKVLADFVAFIRQMPLKKRRELTALLQEGQEQGSSYIKSKLERIVLPARIEYNLLHSLSGSLEFNKRYPFFNGNKNSVLNKMYFPIEILCLLNKNDLEQLCKRICEKNTFAENLHAFGRTIGATLNYASRTAKQRLSKWSDQNTVQSFINVVRQMPEDKRKTFAMFLLEEREHGPFYIQSNLKDFMVPEEIEEAFVDSTAYAMKFAKRYPMKSNEEQKLMDKIKIPVQIICSLDDKGIQEVYDKICEPDTLKDKLYFALQGMRGALRYLPRGIKKYMKLRKPRKAVRTFIATVRQLPLKKRQYIADMLLQSNRSPSNIGNQIIGMLTGYPVAQLFSASHRDEKKYAKNHPHYKTNPDKLAEKLSYPLTQVFIMTEDELKQVTDAICKPDTKIEKIARKVNQLYTSISLKGKELLHSLFQKDLRTEHNADDKSSLSSDSAERQPNVARAEKEATSSEKSSEPAMLHATNAPVKVARQDVKKPQARDMQNQRG